LWVLDWLCDGGSSKSCWSLCLVYLFSRWSPSASVLYATHLVGLCVDCVEWKKLLLFRNSANSLSQMLDKVKLISYRWLKTTNINLVSNYHSWWSSSLVRLGMG
jgi:hypothetical protein